MTVEPDPRRGRARRSGRASVAGSPLVPAPFTSPLVTRTIEVAGRSELLSFLPRMAAPTQVSAWVRRGEGLVGWGEALRVDVRGAQRFAQGLSWWQEVGRHAVVRDDLRLPGTGPVAFGTFAFAEESNTPSSLVVPQCVVGHRSGRWWLTTAGVGALPPAPVLGADLSLAGRDDPHAQPTARRGPADLPGVASADAPPVPRQVRFADGAQSGAQWAAAVARAVERITAGELDKVVLARDLEAAASEPVDPRQLLRTLSRRYDTTWAFAVDGMVGATPEMLVRLEKGLVTSRVLAGTIRRTGNDSSDLALAGSLARSSKDLEEHEYAVRSVAEALAPHCSSMNVPESPFVLHLANVMHLATDVAGVLRDGSTSLELAASLHPSAAVCGTPTQAAARVIAELEQMDRGRYAGPVGWMDLAGDGEWGLALRCGAYADGDARRLRLFAGCGIVAGSDPDAELAEADAKLVPMRDALTAG